MPHIRIRHVPQERLLAVSTRLTDRLQEAVGCDRSWITLDLDTAIAVRDGQVVATTPFVEVLWFPRDAAVAQKAAAILSEELKGDSEYVTVIFRELSDQLYFENGQLL